MARSTKDGDPLLMGYVPAPPGAVDPLDAPPGAAPAGRAPSQKTPTSPPPDAPINKPPADDLPADDESDDAPPFEDELAPPSTPKRSLSLPPERMEPPTPPLRLEDPRDLARRLAEEARQKAVASRPAPTPEPAPAAAAPKKSGLAAKAPPPQAPAPAPAPAPASAASPAPAPAPAAQPERKRSLAERAARPVSAQDALRAAQDAAAREEEAAKAKRKAAKDAAKAAQQAVKAAAVAQEAATRAGAAATAAPAPAPAASPTLAPTTDLATLVGKGLAGAVIEREIVVQNAVVFRALWTAHRARAQATRDLHLLATASVLLDAVDRLPQGCLVAAQLSLGDRTVAVWADLARGVILGFAEPPEIYLAGL